MPNNSIPATEQHLKYTHVAVIPTLRRSVSEISQLAQDLSNCGLEVRIVATGRSLDQALDLAKLNHLSPHCNSGFSSSIHYGSDHGPWDFLYIINDDVKITPTFQNHVNELDSNSPEDKVLAFLDPENKRPVPSVSDVFVSVSLLSSLRNKFSSRQATTDADWYKSFSAVAISRPLWEELEGLDRDLPYTYEDADFTRRARVAHATITCANDGAVVHEGSSTSNRYISSVLPVGVRSASLYLRKHGYPNATTRIVLTLALLIRLPLSLFTPTNRLEHLHAISLSLLGIWGLHDPELPAYQRN